MVHSRQSLLLVSLLAFARECEGALVWPQIVGISLAGGFLLLIIAGAVLYFLGRPSSSPAPEPSSTPYHSIDSMMVNASSHSIAIPSHSSRVTPLSAGTPSSYDPQDERPYMDEEQMSHAEIEARLE